MILEARLDYSALIGDLDMIKELLNNVDWLRLDKRWYFEALIAIDEGKNEDAENYFRALADMNSFNDEAIIASAIYYQSDVNPLRSYNVLVNALLQNPYSTKVLKEYIKESNEQGLVSYASQAADVLKQLIDNEEYDNFINSLSMQ
jgi:hypothetical protein